jgi:acetyl esterase
MIAGILEVANAAPARRPDEIDVAQRRIEYRQMALALWPEEIEVAEVRAETLALDGRDLRARLYVPAASSAAIAVYFHGGSFIVGDLDTHDALCRRLANDLACRVLAVDYRLAPEHPFPAAVDDAIDATRFVAANRSRFGDPGARLVLIGDSAGATLAAVAAAATRGEGLDVVAQALMYPTMGPELLTDSAQRFAHGYLLDVEQIRYDYSLYLSSDADHADPRVTPLMNLDLAGSPPTVILVAEYDPLRDEAVAYGGLLEHFGTPVEVLEAEGMVHGFARMGGIVPDALKDLDDLAEHVRRLLADNS